MDQKLDIATAFDIGLDDAGEQKFQALKNLHAKKIKLLMASVDSSQKEITKLKALSKDNMRTQMIQALRKKIRDIELVVDVLKQEFQSRADMTAAEVNEFVMRKTLGGPKRFRPLTREELEARIAELEKKVDVTEKKLTKKAAGDSAAPSATPRPAARSAGATTTGAASSASLAAADLTRFAQAEVELDELQSSLASKNNLIMKYKEELVRLRARNSELLAAEEDCEIVELQNDELKAELRSAKEEIDQLNRQLVSYHEEFIQHKNDSNMETELKFIDNENLQEQCAKLLKYNASLLKRMAELEVELEQAQAQASGGGAGDNGSGRSYAALEGKVSKLQSKLKAAEEKLKASTTGSGGGGGGEVMGLKDTLRDKNETIRELTKQLAHAQAGKDKDKGAAAMAAAAAAAAGSSLSGKDQKQQQMLQQQVADLQNKLAESERESRSLREANGALAEEVEDLKAELAMFDAPEGEEEEELEKLEEGKEGGEEEGDDM